MGYTAGIPILHEHTCLSSFRESVWNLLMKVTDESFRLDVDRWIERPMEPEPIECDLCGDDGDCQQCWGVGCDECEQTGLCDCERRGR